jgi:hypothetical protein
MGWSDLQDVERARYYELWTKDSSIGGKLAHFMDPRKVRVYIKDSLLKPYERGRLSGTEQAVMRVVGVLTKDEAAQVYIKPHGRRLSDGRVICWGNSRDWKSLLMACFERAFVSKNARPYAVVVVETGKTAEERMKILIREAARRLGVEHVHWMG